MRHWHIRLALFSATLTIMASFGVGELLADGPAATQRSSASVEQPSASEEGISVYFSPGGGCTDAIVGELGRAVKTIRIQAYSFTSAPIAKAVLDAHRRGVDVIVVLDRSQESARYTSATFLFNNGVPVLIDDDHAIAHNKIILIDGWTLITGSFNLSKAAEQANAENLLVIHDKPSLIAAYLENFQEHRSHSIPYAGKLTPPSEEEQPVAADASVASHRAPSAELGKDGPPLTVHVTRSGTRYHAAGCRSLSTTDIKIELESARAKGLQPCKSCRPPE